jgi:type II secretory pathway component PulF
MKSGRETLKGALASAAIAPNVVVVFAIMTPFALLKLAVPALPSRRLCERALTAVA